MSDDGGLDLSGEWDGMYSYPASLPPVAFKANLTERGGALSGIIEEGSAPGEGSSRRASTLEGRRSGLAVTFLKRYEDRSVHHDVDYDGAVSVDGAEISGRWSIFGQWSGPFLMVRKPRKSVARLRQVGERTRA